jgi:transposase-like protein
MGRRSKLTPELQEKICKLIRGGNYLHHAAAACGINQSTLHDWINKGEDGKKPYDEFAKAVAEARGASVAALVLTIKKAAPDDWRAASWMLERGHVGDFGAKRVEVTGRNGSPIQVESWAALVEAAEEAPRGGKK